MKLEYSKRPKWSIRLFLILSLSTWIINCKDTNNNKYLNFSIRNGYLTNNNRLTNQTSRNVRSYMEKNDNYFNFIPYSEITNRIQVFPESKQIEINKINHEELVYSNQLDSFDLNELSDFKEILVDSRHENIFVSAKNYLIKFSYQNNQLKIKDPSNDIVDLRPNDELITECKKLIDEKFCHNYIKILNFDMQNQTHSDRLFVCGTNALRPLCSWRSLSRPAEIYENIDGVGKIPKSPDLSSTYLSLSNGDYYFGTSIDYSDLGMKPDYLIDRSIGLSKQLRTDQYNSNWLNEPTFVASLTIGEYVYFFIKEKALEYMNCGEKVYSRVVRICKHDQGADNYDVWKTFEKARINCSLSAGYRSGQNEFNIFKNDNHPNDSPFYFDEIQDVMYDKKKNLIYAIFTTPSNGMKGSAVCVYNVDSFEAAFQGPFKHQKTPTSIWEPFGQKIETHKCEPPNKNGDSKRSKSKYLDSHKFQLKHLSIQSIYENPIIILHNKRLVKILIDNVQTKQHDVDVLFAATEFNTIRKYKIIKNENNRQPTSCLIEEIELFDKTRQDVSNLINNFVLIENFNSRNLLVATSFNLIKLKVSNCEAQNNYFSCLNSMDPYCIWDSKDQKCLSIFNENLSSKKESLRSLNYLHQNSMNSCPTTKIPIDGGFSDWGQWLNCMSKNGEKCKCRMRICNNPEPRNGGKNCDENQAIEVLDCEINGGWTEWSDWSACKINSLSVCESNSQLKNPTVIRTRTRSCTNPSPRFNGRLCVGPEQEEEICTPEMINPCYSSNQWSSWGAWEECSKTCGEGFQMRRRVCNSKSCTGCNQEWRTCNSQKCPERKSNLLTDWETIEFNNRTRQKLEKRTKLMCKYEPDTENSLTDSMNLNFSLEYRLCKDDKICQSMNDLRELGRWTEWSEWSKCKNCNDDQYRTRKCNHGTCFGNDLETKKCTCKSNIDDYGWSCWSDFSSCSADCGNGTKKRTRICLNEETCEGSNQEIIKCIGTNCTDKSISEKITKHFVTEKEFKFNLFHLVVSCVVMFLLGSFLVLIIVYFSLKSKNRKGLCCCCGTKRLVNKPLTIDHNSDDTGGSSCSTENAKFSSTSSEVGSNSASSSKEYFTIGNRYDPTGISSLLNDAIPDDDDDEDMINVTINSGTLKKSKYNQQKMGTLGLPTKSFNTYVTHKDLNKNSNNTTSSGILNSGNVNNGNSSGTLRFGNYSNMNGSNTLKTNKNQRTSFALPMRTNLDQEL